MTQAVLMDISFGGTPPATPAYSRPGESMYSELHSNLNKLSIDGPWMKVAAIDDVSARRIQASVSAHGLKMDSRNASKPFRFQTTIPKDTPSVLWIRKVGIKK